MSKLLSGAMTGCLLIAMTIGAGHAWGHDHGHGKHEKRTHAKRHDGAQDRAVTCRDLQRRVQAVVSGARGQDRRRDTIHEIKRILRSARGAGLDCKGCIVRELALRRVADQAPC